jgi:type IV pilus assembly protein PilE
MLSREMNGILVARRPGGFSLIELMITLLVVAILASIAVPSYRQYVLRSHRVEAKATLLNVATEQEKFYLQRNRYANDNELVAAKADGGLGFSRDTERGWYRLTLDPDDAGNPQSWTIEATANGTQQDDKRCRFFSLDSTGVRRAGPNLDGSGTTDATSEDCWGK